MRTSRGLPLRRYRILVVLGLCFGVRMTYEYSCGAAVLYALQFAVGDAVKRSAVSVIVFK